jgi:hypothetical protein
MTESVSEMLGQEDGNMSMPMEDGVAPDLTRTPNAPAANETIQILPSHVIETVQYQYEKLIQMCCDNHRKQLERNDRTLKIPLEYINEFLSSLAPLIVVLLQHPPSIFVSASVEDPANVSDYGPGSETNPCTINTLSYTDSFISTDSDPLSTPKLTVLVAFLSQFLHPFASLLEKYDHRVSNDKVPSEKTIIEITPQPTNQHPETPTSTIKLSNDINQHYDFLLQIYLRLSLHTCILIWKLNEYLPCLSSLQKPDELKAHIALFNHLSTASLISSSAAFNLLAYISFVDNLPRSSYRAFRQYCERLAIALDLDQGAELFLNDIVIFYHAEWSTTLNELFEDLSYNPPSLLLPYLNNPQISFAPSNSHERKKDLPLNYITMHSSESGWSSPVLVASDAPSRQLSNQSLTSTVSSPTFSSISNSSLKLKHKAASTGVLGKLAALRRHRAWIGEASTRNRLVTMQVRICRVPEEKRLKKEKMEKLERKKLKSERHDKENHLPSSKSNPIQSLDKSMLTQCLLPPSDAQKMTEDLLKTPSKTIDPSTILVTETPHSQQLPRQRACKYAPTRLFANQVNSSSSSSSTSSGTFSALRQSHSSSIIIPMSPPSDSLVIINESPTHPSKQNSIKYSTNAHFPPIRLRSSLAVRSLTL